MSQSHEQSITKINKGSQPQFTKITFQPDLKLFSMNNLTQPIVELMQRRVYYVAGILGPNVKVFLNKSQITINTFQKYAAKIIKSEDLAY